MSSDDQGRTSSARISEALEILNEAAKEKTAELKGLMGNKYAHIREAMSAESSYGEDVIKRARDFAQDAIGEGQARCKEIACNVDKRVHQDPWVYIAGAAAASLLLGYFAGSKRK